MSEFTKSLDMVCIRRAPITAVFDDPRAAVEAKRLQQGVIEIEIQGRTCLVVTVRESFAPYRCTVEFEEVVPL